MDVKRIIVSADDSQFVEFLPAVYSAWKKFFPEIRLTLAFLSDREHDDPIFDALRKYADLYVYNSIDGIPVPNQAKMIRYICATQFEDEVVSVEDIDTIPLQREWFEKKFSERKPGTMLRVGKEVFYNTIFDDKMPISTMTAEGHVWKSLINPLSLSYNDLMNSWKTPLLKTKDNKQNFGNKPEVFSDESLIQCLMWETKTPETFVFRDVNIHKDWIDRSFWKVDVDKLNRGEYICCNFLRPFRRHKEFFKPILKYIDYEGDLHIATEKKG